MKTINVKNENSYNILIGENLLENAGAHICDVGDYKKALIMSDSNVAPLYAKTLQTSLEERGIVSNLFVFPAGEVSKTFSTIENMLSAMCEYRLTRSDLVIALGGGVCGDMAGFAAAIYLRGIDFVQIPTTLLSQVDSSVGGKTGCDLTSGKNLAGAFHNPRLVLIDINALKTLPQKYMRDGMGEVIKYGCILDSELFARLDTGDYNIEDIIYECVNLKRIVVEEDFKEQGRRMLLNFGHTIGHAIEKCENFKGLSHGEAVSVGMMIVTKASERKSLTQNGTTQRLCSLLEKTGLPTSTNISYEELCTAAIGDKKMRGKQLNLVLIKDIGNSFVEKIDAKDLLDFIK